MPIILKLLEVFWPKKNNRAPELITLSQDVFTEKLLKEKPMLVAAAILFVIFVMSASILYTNLQSPSTLLSGFYNSLALSGFSISKDSTMGLSRYSKNRYVFLLVRSWIPLKYSLFILPILIYSIAPNIMEFSVILNVCIVSLFSFSLLFFVTVSAASALIFGMAGIYEYPWQVVRIFALNKLITNALKLSIMAVLVSLFIGVLATHNKQFLDGVLSRCDHVIVTNLYKFYKCDSIFSNAYTLFRLPQAVACTVLYAYTFLIFYVWSFPLLVLSVIIMLGFSKQTDELLKIVNYPGLYMREQFVRIALKINDFEKGFVFDCGDGKKIRADELYLYVLTVAMSRDVLYILEAKPLLGRPDWENNSLAYRNYNIVVNRLDKNTKKLSALDSQLRSC